jgi:hypothetical protein
VAAAVEELQEQLLAREVELSRWEEALAVWEEKAQITEKTLVKVTINLDAEQAKTEASR